MSCHVPARLYNSNQNKRFISSRQAQILYLHIIKINTIQMSPHESLHYAIGEIVYAVAAADGIVQREERKRLEEIVAEELKRHHYEYDFSHIIFQLLNSQHRKSMESYEWGMNGLRLHSHYLSPALKAAFVSLVEKVALAFPPVTEEETNLLSRFKRDIAPLHGDPVYYSKQ